jgi:death-on-curing protein
MRYLTLEEVLALQQRVIEQSGGAAGVRDVNLVDSAVAQPSMTFDGNDLFSTPDGLLVTPLPAKA